jgi:hypothetical protein
LQEVRPRRSHSSPQSRVSRLAVLVSKLQMQGLQTSHGESMNQRTKIIVAVLSVWLFSVFLYGFFHHDQMRPPLGPANA